MSGTPCLSGGGCFATLLHLCMCVRDTVCGVERVRDACGVCLKRWGTTPNGGLMALEGYTYGVTAYHL
jgi:hypothetical protein